MTWRATSGRPCAAEGRAEPLDLLDDSAMRRHMLKDHRGRQNDDEDTGRAPADVARVLHVIGCHLTDYAVLVGGSNGDGAWRGIATIVELIDPRPYNSAFQSRRLIYAVICMSDRLLTRANPYPRLRICPPHQYSVGINKGSTCSSQVPGPTLALDLPARRTFLAVFKVLIVLYCFGPVPT